MIEQIVNRGIDTIAEIERQLEDNAQRIASSLAELNQIQASRVYRVKQIEDARSDVERLQDAYGQALAYAKLVHDTPNEQWSIKAVSSAKRELTSARKELAKAESSHQSDDQELISILQDLRREQENLRSDLAHTQAAHKQSHQAMGEHKRDALMQSYQEHNVRVDILKSQLVEAQSALYDFHQNAQEELAEWPNLQREVRNLHPSDDHMSRLLDATIRYIDTLINDMDHINGDFPGTPWSLWDSLIIPTQEVRGAIGHLQERHKKIDQIIEAYRQYCASA